MISATLTATNGSTAMQPWLRESVQAFFEGVNWNGLAPRSAASPGAVSPGLGVEDPLTMTVGQFFEVMSWEGKPTIGLPIAPLEVPAATADIQADDITLDDFSSLFG